MDKLSQELRSLQPKEKKLIYVGKRKTKVFVIRTDKICPHDFAVSLFPPNYREFRPTHIRLLFDLYLKRISAPQQAKKFFEIANYVYEKEDPAKYSPEALKLQFPMQLDDPDVTFYYMQLLMIEQEFNYGPLGCKHGKVLPPREFLMRFIRWVASGDEEIDRIIQLAVRNMPAPAKYSKKI
jgi:hypothetical protein